VSFADIMGQKIYYEVHGNGDAIVLLHNGFACSKIWEHIYPLFVEKGYKTVLYDRRGFGRSEKGSDFKKFYLSDSFRSDTVGELALLLDMLDIDSFHAVGQCEGGVIAVDYALAYPRHVNTAVLASTQCYSDVSMRELNRLKFPKAFGDIKQKHRDKFIYWHGKDHAETFYEMFRTCGGAYGTELFDLRNLLPSVTCPTLVLYPDRSFLFDVEQAIALYRHLPQGELAVLPKCGHNIYEHYPREYAHFVLDFIERHCSKESARE
jgi:3-oxoadipate enol-lactonase